MTVAAQGSDVGFAIQPAKIGRDNTFVPGDVDWYRISGAPDVSFGTVEDQRPYPLTLGGPMTLEGTYKAGMYAGGVMELVPRLEDSLGLLLLAQMGACSSVTGKNVFGANTVNVNTHIFTYDPSNPAIQPWMAVRRLVPGESSGDENGETAYDCKIARMRISVQPGAPIGAQLTMVGRDVQYDDGSTWAWVNNYEDPTSTPQSNTPDSYVKLGGVEYPMVGLVLDFETNLTTPDREYVLGDPHPDDFLALTRLVTARFVYKYSVKDLHRQALTNSASGTAWDILPKNLSTSGPNFALDAYFEAPNMIGATSTPFAIRIRANKINLQVEGPIRTQAGDTILQTFVCNFLRPSAGAHSEILIQNAQTEYVVPS